MFHDRAQIHVQAGRGGDGGLHFRREKHVPKGGPDGGDGGPGGDVVLVADPDLRDLSAFRAKQRFKAGSGGAGPGCAKHGATAKTVELRVPVGTQVLDEDGQVIADLAHRRRADRRRARRAGRAAATSASPSPTRRAPRFAETGLPGEEATLDLRLKLLADAALVGLPERRQVIAASPDLECEAEGRRLSVHDARADPRHGRCSRRDASSPSPTCRA